MKIPRLNLGPKLSSFSWLFIELFTLLTIAFLPFSKSAADISIVIALFLWILRKFPWNERWKAPRPYTLLYLLFLVFSLLSLFQVPHPLFEIGVRGFLKWLKFVGVFFLCAEMFQERKRVYRFLFVFLVSMTLACLNGFYQLVMGQDLVKHYSADMPGRFTRMAGSFSSPNGLAAFLLLAIPLVFFLWFRQKKWSPKSTLYAVALAIFSVSFAMTLSRAAGLAFFIALIAYLLKQKNIKALLLLLGVTALFLVSSNVTRINFFSSLHRTDITVGERLSYWHTTWQMILAHPWLGNGVNMYFQKFPAFAPAAETYRGYAHNSYLQMWSEIGLFGLLSFLAPIVIGLGRWFFRKGSEGADHLLKDALGIGLLAFLIQAGVDTHFYALQTALLFWIVWGLLISLE